jgi:hypothetical protein
LQDLVEAADQPGVLVDPLLLVHDAKVVDNLLVELHHHLRRDVRSLPDAAVVGQSLCCERDEDVNDAFCVLLLVAFLIQLVDVCGECIAYNLYVQCDGSNSDGKVTWVIERGYDFRK